MNVKVETRPKVKSRKVNRYVKWILIQRALQRKLDSIQDQIDLTGGTLTGGQLAEAQKVLNDQTNVSHS